MQRRIVGFGLDEEGDRYAVLDCGHRQHVRHRPPFFNRPWTLTEEGRNRMLGQTLSCVLCDEPGDCWFSLLLGDALIADARLAEIQKAFARARAERGARPEIAVFKRHDTEHSLQCEVTVYFSPAAAEIAGAFWATPCAQPLSRCLELVAGDARSWEALFPGQSRRSTDLS
jgi:Protein of unknown function (DUF3565)